MGWPHVHSVLGAAVELYQLWLETSNEVGAALANDILELRRVLM